MHRERPKAVYNVNSKGGILLRASTIVGYKVFHINKMLGAEKRKEKNKRADDTSIAGLHATTKKLQPVCSFLVSVLAGFLFHVVLHVHASIE
jgi:hypothetical protein